MVYIYNIYIWMSIFIFIFLFLLLLFFFILIFFFRQFLAFAKRKTTIYPTACKSSETDVAKIWLFVITSEVLGKLPRVHVDRLPMQVTTDFLLNLFFLHCSILPVGTNSVTPVTLPTCRK